MEKEIDKNQEKNNSVPDIVIITGLSGSGMSSATNAFQDLGYFCVDNLPLTMLQTFARLITSEDDEKVIRRAALVIDIREGVFLAEFEKQLLALRDSGLTVTVLFFEASNDVLQHRFSETRRPHPAEKARRLGSCTGCVEQDLGIEDVRAPRPGGERAGCP